MFIDDESDEEIKEESKVSFKNILSHSTWIFVARDQMVLISINSIYSEKMYLLNRIIVF